ncbi:MAG: 2-isopropylmalate synthase [Treponema sp.]|jgi:2-isopropylmalate synthase|nr:2-isopropylmalate synthase [Treponema sp.]
MRRVTIFDTTLRDGDQAFCFGGKEKLALAMALAEAGADVIETGFPLSSGIDFEFCKTAARELQNFAVPGNPLPRPLAAVMCRGIPRDIDKSAKVFSGGIPGILHISLPVSRIHIEAKLGKTEKELIVLARRAVSFAAGLVTEMELGAEDAFRADRDFLLEYCQAALDAGARRVNIADTLGASSPGEVRELTAFLCSRIPAFALEGEGAVLSIHCHNDMGLACANTLAALAAGCGQAELSVSGIGERAGNAALEEVGANIELRSRELGLYANLKPEKFPELINMAAAMAGGAFSPMKPLSGWNTRSHGSGIHQQGLSRNTETYSLPGVERWATVPERIVLSRHSGKAGTALFAERYCGLALDEKTVALAAEKIKDSETLTGITEFLCILSDMGKLPAEFPGPFIRLSFTETFTGNGAVLEELFQVSAVLGVYGAAERAGEISGNGNSAALAVSEALGRLCGWKPEFSPLAVNGYSGRIRLYTEIRPPSGSCYALERIGPSVAELLLLCGLDAVNAEMARSGKKLIKSGFLTMSTDYTD